MENTSLKNQQVILQQLMAAFTAIPFNHMLGLKLDALNRDQAVMSFEMKNDLIGNYMFGILHGGVISSVLDMAGGMVAMHSSIEKHPDCSKEELVAIVSKCSTIDLHINYVRPGKGARFMAKAYLIKSGQHISFTRMELFNDADSLIATASGTYLLK